MNGAAIFYLKNGNVRVLFVFLFCFDFTQFFFLMLGLTTLCQYVSLEYLSIRQMINVKKNMF